MPDQIRDENVKVECTPTHFWIEAQMHSRVSNFAIPRNWGPTAIPRIQPNNRGQLALKAVDQGLMHMMCFCSARLTFNDP